MYSQLIFAKDIFSSFLYTQIQIHIFQLDVKYPTFRHAHLLLLPSPCNIVKKHRSITLMHMNNRKTCNNYQREQPQRIYGQQYITIFKLWTIIVKVSFDQSFRKASFSKMDHVLDFNIIMMERYFTPKITLRNHQMVSTKNCGCKY